MLKSLRSPATLLALLVALCGALLVLYAWKLPPFRNAVETTENAYVKGQVTILSPQLAGYVKTVAVQDYQLVKAGDLIVQIDDRIYDQKVKQAQALLAGQKANLANADQSVRSAQAKIGSSEAQIASAQAALRTAEATSERINPLLEKGIATQATADQATQALDQARAGLRQAEAALEVSRQDLQSIVVNRQSLEAGVQNAEATVQLAEIDLQNTRILAPQDGRLGEIGVRLGQYVSAGTQLTSLVPVRKWVIANFKETQLYGMKLGQPVSFTVDALRHQTLTGHIQEFSPATGSEFSVLKADNATGNFTKIAQRLPVRIAIDDNQPLVAQLAPGMSVVVSIDTAAAAEGVPALR
ncbi:Multidrug resistance efflux pump [Bosea sp. OK403]|uniref:HlyD family secretion protein n=1 Tax=Bosea sp. OK403 TaxID=1855286 RepID=UPI0008E953DF|nr:HlyD family secretion protein [Bosea sp. OK403]SFJ21177.1 Multidrug resistance efflux pump [Bosea sp. OK403]